MEFNGITDKEAIAHFNNKIKRLSKKKLEETYYFSTQVVKVKDISDHIKKDDLIGKHALLAEKIYMIWEEKKDWDRNIQKNFNLNEKNNLNRKEESDVVMVVSSPSIDPFNKFQESYQKQFLCPAINGYYGKKPKTIVFWNDGPDSFICDKDAYYKPAYNKYILEYLLNNEFSYFTTMTHGFMNAIVAQDGLDFPLFRNDFEDTKIIAKDNHFHFFACSAGVILARWMVLNGAKAVHAYNFIVITGKERDIADDDPYIYAATTVDRDLLSGKTHFQAHWNCKKTYFEKAKEEFNNENYVDATFLLYDGFLKDFYGYPYLKLGEVQNNIPSIHVKNIKMSIDSQRVWWFRKLRGVADVSVETNKEKPESGVYIEGNWRGNAINNCNGITNKNGEARLYSEWYWSNKGNFTFSVESLHKEEREYKPEDNKETTDSIKT